MLTSLYGYLPERFTPTVYRLRNLIKIIPQLEKLSEDLFSLEKREPEPLKRLVSFFNLISPWGDQGGVGAEIEEVKKTKRFPNLVKNLESLNFHFVHAGRNLYGMNRTKRGQHVSPQDVFLGDIYGLFTHPIPFWLERKNEPKGGWGGELEKKLSSLNSYDVVARQARVFMDSHVEEMVILIGFIQKEVKKI